VSRFPRTPSCSSINVLCRGLPSLPKAPSICGPSKVEVGLGTDEVADCDRHADRVWRLTGMATEPYPPWRHALCQRSSLDLSGSVPTIMPELVKLDDAVGGWMVAWPFRPAVAIRIGC
jgi:hypothetical protein